jgi:hypothetical protein
MPSACPEFSAIHRDTPQRDSVDYCKAAGDDFELFGEKPRLRCRSRGSGGFSAGDADDAKDG